MISKEEVQNLGTLARLKLTDAETATLQKDISAVLEYVETVSTVEIPQNDALRDKGNPLLRNIMREDIPRSADDTLAGKQNALLEALPKREGDYAVVRKIIQKDE